MLTEYVTNKRRSIKRVEDSVEHLIGFFGEHARARRVDEARIGEYIKHRQGEGAANGTINRELTALRRAFNLARKSRRIAYVPNISLFREADPRQGFVERDQLDAILSRLPVPVRLVVLVAYITGWRVASEVLTRQWKHVDFKAGFLRLEPGETKNRDGRMFPLLPELKKVLEQQRSPYRRRGEG